jgi:hypothetical protein
MSRRVVARPDSKPTEPTSLAKPPSDEFDSRHWAVLGMGVIGGLGISNMVYDWATDKGTSKPERREEVKQIAGFALATSILYATAQMPWGKWLDINKIGDEADKAIAKAVK